MHLPGVLFLLEFCSESSPAFQMAAACIITDLDRGARIPVFLTLVKGRTSAAVSLWDVTYGVPKV